MTDPLISVVIDTFNYGRFIDEAIESVLRQEYPAERVQVVVVDDGSTDDTTQRIVKYEPRIEYHRKPNGGQASALNLGFKKARGEIVALLDADDYWLPAKLRHVVEGFENHSDAGMIYNSLTVVGSSETPPGFADFIPVSGYLAKDIQKLLQYRVHPTSCLTFRRGSLERLLPIPESIRLQADAYLALLAPLVLPVLAIPESLTAYRIHGQNLYSTQESKITSEQRRRRSAMWTVVLGHVGEWLENNGFDVTRGEIRTFLDQVLLFHEASAFVAEPPSRTQYFSYLLRQNRTYRSQQTWKLTIINYFNAIASLLFGYEYTQRFLRLEPKIAGWIRIHILNRK